MQQAQFTKYVLQFKRPSGTSRGVMTTKTSYFIHLKDRVTGATGIGECGLLAGLSCDDRPDYEDQLAKVCQAIEVQHLELSDVLEWPSIRFGVEMAQRDLRLGAKCMQFPSAFTEGTTPIPINGLVWMGSAAFMRQQIREKLDQGYGCIKLKIGAIDFEEELTLLQSIRKEYSAADIELRVDANGAFAPSEALEKLKRLSDFELHSIEQPIAAKQWEHMAALTATTPLPIALDEELIGVHTADQKKILLETIQPQYIILKPSLHGGIAGCKEWIALAEEQHIGWWMTSALESNIGLSAVAQFTATYNNPLPQGLGTGQLYTNNFPSPLSIGNGALHFNPEDTWDLALLPTP